MKRPGISRSSPALSICSVKQKHSVLAKKPDASVGAMDGAALPTIAVAALLRAMNVASYCLPGCTTIDSCTGLKSQGSLELTVPSNWTRTSRATWDVMPAAACAPMAPRSSLMPKIFSQATLYSGTSENANTNEPAEISAMRFSVRARSAVMSRSSSTRGTARTNPPRRQPRSGRYAGSRSGCWLASFQTSVGDVAVGQVAVLDDRRRGEAVVRRRRGQGPLQATGAFPAAVGGLDAALGRFPDDVGEQQLRDAETEATDG